jgi:hypothetical protein
MFQIPLIKTEVQKGNEYQQRSFMFKLKHFSSHISLHVSPTSNRTISKLFEFEGNDDIEQTHMLYIQEALSKSFCCKNKPQILY